MSYSNTDEHAIRALMESHDPYGVMEEARARLSTEKIRREEFYNLVHENMKAEFIGGEIVFHSPVRARHWQVSQAISSPMFMYVREHNLGKVGVEKVMISLGRNDFEPDIVFFRKDVAEGFSPDQKLFPAPELIVEILSASTAERDRGVKFDEYALGGVEEYWIVDPERNTLEQYINAGKQFVLLKSHPPVGTLECKAITGFTLDLMEVFAE